MSSTAIVKAILAAVRSFPQNLQCLRFSPLLLLVSCVLLLLVLFISLVFIILNICSLCLLLLLFPHLPRLLLKLLLQRRKLCSPHWVSSVSVLNLWRRKADAAHSRVQALHLSSRTAYDKTTNVQTTDNNELTTFHKTRKT